MGDFPIRVAPETCDYVGPVPILTVVLIVIVFT